MIVDMERSDLSRVCIPGTVKIDKEKYVRNTDTYFIMLQPYLEAY